MSLCINMSKPKQYSIHLNSIQNKYTIHIYIYIYIYIKYRLYNAFSIIN